MNGVPNISSSLLATTVPVDIGQYKQLSLTYDNQQNAMWLHMKSKPRPCFTPTLLHELDNVFSLINEHDETTTPIDYLVAASGTPGIYSLGGDLHYFQECIESQDKERLRKYGYACIDVSYQCAKQFDRNVTTIALVQGQAMGGGFEGALACNIIIAEEDATFGFPEILFNLFPGMGAHVYLSRRISPYAAQRMLSSGNQYTAQQMYDMGIVDVLVKKGEGVSATTDFIRRHRSRLLAHRAIYQANIRLNPVSIQELRDINDIWVETAMQISSHDLKTMARLVRAQERLNNARAAG